MNPAGQAWLRLQQLTENGEVAAFCRLHAIRLLVVFGSAVQHRDAPPKDLDLAVLLEDREHGDVFGVVAELVALLHSDALDVMDLARAGVLARAEALGGGRPLFEAQPGSFAEQQMRALGQRMESGWLVDLQLESLARG